MPYWNRQSALDAMFATYARLYSHLDLEISVCDDGSPVPAVVPPGSRIRLTRMPAKINPLNPCVPFNRAVAASTGDVIVLTNPEIEHQEPVLDEMLSLLQHPDDYVVARCWDDRGFYVAGPDVKFDERGRLPAPPGGQFHFLAMLHRDLWERCGGFDEDYRGFLGADDNDLLWRLYSVGARFRLTEGRVYHKAGERLAWNLPHGRTLFYAKWPEAIGG